MFPITERFVSAEIEYRRERALTGRNRRLVAVPASRPRPPRALSFVHRVATGH